MNTYTKDQLFRFRLRFDGSECHTTLTAQYEVDLTPIGGHLGPDGASALQMYSLWRDAAARAFPDGLIPIYWTVRPGDWKIEHMPFEFDAADEDFRNFYTTPAVDGEEFSWFRLHVEDRDWSRDGWTNSGFLQEATGWKPQLLAPFVHLRMLDALVDEKARVLSLA